MSYFLCPTQIRHEGTIATRMFFNWFYWCVNVGALVALGVLAYVQQELSFFWGFLTPGICLVIALLVFAIGEHHLEFDVIRLYSGVIKTLCSTSRKQKFLPSVLRCAHRRPANARSGYKHPTRIVVQVELYQSK